MRGQGMGYSFDFDDMMQFDGNKLHDKFKIPQLQNFDGIGTVYWKSIIPIGNL